MSSSVGHALLLTLLGAAGTALGGLLVVVQPCMSFKRLGALQGLAGGLMLSLSILDLLPEAVEEIGFVAANVSFYTGVAFFAAVVALIPEPDSMLVKQVRRNTQINRPDADGAAKVMQHEDTATGHGIAAAIPATSGTAETKAGTVLSRTASPGGASASASRSQSPLDSPLLADAAAVAGPHGAPEKGACHRRIHNNAQLQQELLQRQHSSAHSDSADSSVLSADLDVVLEEHCSGAEDRRKLQQQQLLMSGLITAVGIALHNFPEGVAVFLAAQKSHAIGVSLAVAIALHNIPEGVAVALPVYYATGSRMQGLKTAVLSGLAEPLAVVLLGLLFPATQLNKHVVDAMLAGVGGIMAFLAFHELLPLSLKHAGQSLAVGCFFAGMALMSFNLHLLNIYVMPGFH